mgnify:FL=1
MIGITRFLSIGIPAFIGTGNLLLGNRVIKNEKKLKQRELELSLQLDHKFD